MRHCCVYFSPGNKAKEDTFSFSLVMFPSWPPLPILTLNPLAGYSAAGKTYTPTTWLETKSDCKEKAEVFVFVTEKFTITTANLGNMHTVVYPCTCIKIDGAVHHSGSHTNTDDCQETRKVAL